jgi:hypothetical protein
MGGGSMYTAVETHGHEHHDGSFIFSRCPTEETGRRLCALQVGCQNTIQDLQLECAELIDSWCVPSAEVLPAARRKEPPYATELEIDTNSGIRRLPNDIASELTIPKTPW